MGRKPAAGGGLQLRAWPGDTHANTLLGGYRGILQCDGYAAYKKFAASKSVEPSVTLAFCWSHVRRGFYDLAKAKAPIAIEALKRIAALYAIEADIRGKTATDRRSARQAESKPLIVELRVWFEAQLAKLPARGPTAEAIRYALNHWDGLQRFLDDGRIELDNNSVERAMRPVCLSRKNSAPYCSSDDVLIKQGNFAADFEKSGAVTAWPRRLDEWHRAAGQQAGLSRVLRHRAAGLEARRRGPFGRPWHGLPSEYPRPRRALPRRARHARPRDRWRCR
jgi:hypothetical protein